MIDFVLNILYEGMKLIFNFDKVGLVWGNSFISNLFCCVSIRRGV